MLSRIFQSDTFNQPTPTNNPHSRIQMTIDYYDLHQCYGKLGRGNDIQLTTMAIIQRHTNRAANWRSVENWFPLAIFPHFNGGCGVGGRDNKNQYKRAPSKGKLAQSNAVCIASCTGVCRSGSDSNKLFLLFGECCIIINTSSLNLYRIQYGEKGHLLKYNQLNFQKVIFPSYSFSFSSKVRMLNGLR